MSATGANGIKLLRVGGAVVIGLYGAALCYRLGLVRRILPAAINEQLEAKVEKLKAQSEPPTGSAQFAVARGHLLRTYGFAAGGLMLGCFGAAAFCKLPHIPIGLAIAATITPSVVLHFVPQRFMTLPSRGLLFAAACLACGYTLGPMNYVALDTLIPFGFLVGSTVVGFSVPLFLTRGMISYFFSTQLLSCSLATVLSSGQLSQAIDVNVMLTVQMLANAVLAIAHTIPVVRKCVSWTEPLDKLEAELDPLLEGFHICGSVSYGVFAVFRALCTSVLLAVTRDDKFSKGATKEERRYLRTFANMTLNVEKWSKIFSSIMFAIVYVRVVSYLQQKGSVQQLDRWRQLFARFSPVRLIVTNI